MISPPENEKAAPGSAARHNPVARKADLSLDIEVDNFIQVGDAAYTALAAANLNLTDIEAEYFDVPPAVLSAKVWGGLYDLGVTGRGLHGEGRCGALGADTVQFIPNGFFEFCRVSGFTNPVPAIIVPVFDDLGDLVDLCAWSHTANRIALWRGAAPALGLENVYAPRLDGPLEAHPTILSWLRAGRRGVFIIDHQLTSQRLAGVTLRVEAPRFGRELIQQMTTVPRVVVGKRAA